MDVPLGDLNSDGEIHALDSVPVMFANRPQIEMFPHEYGAAKFDSTSDENWSEAHFYAECSGKGTCNRESGLCECAEGYNGEGCTRVACPSSTEQTCSGHGTCERISDDDMLSDRYRSWDKTKTQHCVCDPGFTGIACDMRMCPSGDDPITKFKKQIKICTSSAIDSATSSLIGMTLHGVRSDASATLESVDYSNRCVYLINERGMFTDSETVIGTDSSVVIPIASTISRQYDETSTQVNEVQTISIKASGSSNSFALRFVDQYGMTYTSRSIECDGTVTCIPASNSCVADPDDRFTATSSAVTICGQHNETLDTSDCTLQTYDIVDTCMYDALQTPDNETEATMICENANLDESTCISETYESGSLPVSCVWVSAQVDGGTCVSAVPDDQDNADSACSAASSSRNTCLSAQYDADVSSGVEFLRCTTATDITSARESCRDQIEQSLEDLPLQVIRDVDVRDVTPIDLSTLIYAHETMVFDVHFVENSGDLPNLQTLGKSESDAFVEIHEKLKGTTESAPCSNRGICDHSLGVCQCFQGFTKHDCSKQNALAMY